MSENKNLKNEINNEGSFVTREQIEAIENGPKNIDKIDSQKTVSSRRKFVDKDQKKKEKELLDAKKKAEAEKERAAKEAVMNAQRLQREEERAKKKAERNRNKIVKNPNKSKRLKKKFYNIERYETDLNIGLTTEQVDSRIAKGLNNSTSHGSTKTIGQIILGNVFTFLNLLTFTIAGLLISVQSYDNLVFLVIILANLIIGIIQEIKAKKTIDKLSLIAAPTCEVIRDGKHIDVAVEEVVLDDLMVLENGRQICSDAIVVDGSIEVNESLLTGEADEIIKNPGDKLYSGSFVTSGNCIAKVDKVGAENYIETLTEQAKKYKKPNSELMKSLKKVIKFMSFIIIIMGAALFYVQLEKSGLEYEEAVTKTAGAVIGMIPSGLYLVTSVALAVGVIRLAKNNVLVQELYCIEMLARIDVLCLDKTGTITDGSMNVRNVIDYNIIEGLTTKNIVSAILNATNDNNMTNQALEEKFGRATRLKHSSLIPFSSKRKYSAVTFEEHGTFVIGAPEFVMKENFKQVEQDVNKCAKEGYRVLVVAHTDKVISQGEIDHSDLKPISLILIEDNVRPDAIETIAYFKRSGVDVKVISGDNPITVSKVSERAGIENAHEYISLDGLSEAEVIRAASKYTVFGRVSPTQKKLLVETLQKQGKKVAMTGDGVNDILALREADCSIAVASGSEAARNVSHLVLLDSNFDSMPKVVAEGRRVISNIAKVAKLYLTKTIFSLLLACVCLLEGSYPIQPKQLLMIDLLCIGIPSMALIFEPNNNKAPNRFLKTIIQSAVPGAFVIVIQSILVFMLKNALNMTPRITSTVIAITATFTCMMVLFETCKPFHTKMRKALFGGVFSTFVLATIFLPNYFDFAPVSDELVYYPEDEKAYIWETPLISISEQSYFVYDGFVLNLKCEDTSLNYEYRVDKNGQFNIREAADTEWLATNYYPVVTEYSESMSGKIVIGGTKILNVDYSSNATYTAEAEKDGTLIIVKQVDNEVKKYETNINVLPKVTIKNNEYYINDNTPTGTKTAKDKVGTVTLTREFDVLVDGNSIKYNLYGKSDMVFSHSNNTLYYGGKESEEAYVSGMNIGIYDKYYVFKDAYGNVIKDAEGNDDIVDGLVYNPKSALTEAGHYIVDGYYTDYIYTGNGADFRVSLYVANDKDFKNGLGYLKLGGEITNIQQNFIPKEGPNPVQPLPVTCIILIVALCLSSMMLIKVTKAIIPATKQQIKKITDVITNLQ